jgi:hypothetical protein
MKREGRREREGGGGGRERFELVYLRYVGLRLLSLLSLSRCRLPSSTTAPCLETGPSSKSITRKCSILRHLGQPRPKMFTGDLKMCTFTGVCVSLLLLVISHLSLFLSLLTFATYIRNMIRHCTLYHKDLFT